MQHRHLAGQRSRSDGTAAFAESLREQPRPLPELCRRHVPVAWRTAMAITSDPAEASEAVSRALTEVLTAAGEEASMASSLRPQLLAATREVAVSSLRRAPQPRHGPTEATAGADIELAGRVAGAFRSLPERWRSVLWLVEVERIPAPEAARIIGVDPPEVATLTSRAWAGLRELSLADQRPEPAEPAPSSPYSPPALQRGACRPIEDRIAGYFSGALNAPQRAEVDAHLCACPSCQAHLAQLQELATTLRQVVVPLPEGLLSAATATLERGETAQHKSRSGLLADVGKPLVRAWLAALGLAIIGVAVLDQASTPLLPQMKGPEKTSTESAPSVAGPQANRSTPQPKSDLSFGRTAASVTNSTPASASAGTTPTPTTPPTSGPTASPRVTGSAGKGTDPSGSATKGASSTTPGAAGSSLLVLPTNVLLPTVTQPTDSLLPQVALDTGVAGIPIALNIGPCTGVQLAFLSVGCTSPTSSGG